MVNFFLEKHNVGPASVSYFTLISDILCVACKTLISPSIGVNKQLYEIISNSLKFLHISSQCSAQFSKQVANNDNLMKTMLQLINRFAGYHVNGTLAEVSDSFPFFFQFRLRVMIMQCTLV